MMLRDPILNESEWTLNRMFTDLRILSAKLYHVMSSYCLEDLFVQEDTKSFKLQHLDPVA
eukprot:scaffold248396_cov65-Cyclotella_meneghiniana.AAC.3